MKKLEFYLGPNKPEALASLELPAGLYHPDYQFGVVKENRLTGEVVPVDAYCFPETAEAVCASVSKKGWFGVLCRVRLVEGAPSAAV